MEYYIPRGTTVSNETYYGLYVNHVRPLARSKRGLLSFGVLLRRDNAQPHTSRAPAQQTMNQRLDCLLHLTYSPDLPQCECHTFGPFREALG